MKDWIVGILNYIVSYAVRFIIGLVLLVVFLYVLNAMGIL